VRSLVRTRCSALSESRPFGLKPQNWFCAVLRQDGRRRNTVSDPPSARHHFFQPRWQPYPVSPLRASSRVSDRPDRPENTAPASPSPLAHWTRPFACSSLFQAQVLVQSSVGLKIFLVPAPTATRPILCPPSACVTPALGRPAQGHARRPAGAPVGSGDEAGRASCHPSWTGSASRSARPAAGRPEQVRLRRECRA